MKPSASSFETLRSLVQQHTAPSTQQLAAFADALSEDRLAKGDAFLRAGTPATEAAIVVDGVLGEFYESSDGTRKAKWLAGPGQVIGSLEDLVRGGPARASIVALTDSTVLRMRYAQLREMALTEPVWTRFFVAMLEALYRGKSEREYTLLMLRAHDRYRWFRTHYGELENLLPQDVIASYLGITPVHLSRVRRNAPGLKAS